MRKAALFLLLLHFVTSAAAWVQAQQPVSADDYFKRAHARQLKNDFAERFANQKAATIPEIKPAQTS